ncbi:MAG: hypothetical protein ACLP9L_20905 [Thermoguttaceae bacterium]
MSQGIAINGRKLEEVQMPMAPHSPGVCCHLRYPKTRIKFSLTTDTLVLCVPPLLGMELYRSGVLPQDPQVPVAIKIGGRPTGQFVVVDVRYAGGYSQDVVITLGRVRKWKAVSQRPVPATENPREGLLGILAGTSR